MASACMERISSIKRLNSTPWLITTSTGRGFLTLRGVCRGIATRVPDFEQGLRAYLRACERIYRASTLSRAHGVLRQKARLDLMLGSLLKQRISIRSANPSQ